MTVEELVHELMKLDKKLEVLVEDFETGWSFRVVEVLTTDTHPNHEQPVKYAHVNGGEDIPLGTKFVFISASIEASDRAQESDPITYELWSEDATSKTIVDVAKDEGTVGTLWDDDGDDDFLWHNRFWFNRE